MFLFQFKVPLILENLCAGHTEFAEGKRNLCKEEYEHLSIVHFISISYTYGVTISFKGLKIFF